MDLSTLPWDWFVVSLLVIVVIPLLLQSYPRQIVPHRLSQLPIRDAIVLFPAKHFLVVGLAAGHMVKLQVMALLWAGFVAGLSYKEQ